MTGSDDYDTAASIRLDLTEFLEESVHQWEIGNTENNAWWRLFHNSLETRYHNGEKVDFVEITLQNKYLKIIGIREYIEDHRRPARHAGEREKWASNVDYISAAKMYQINVIVVSPNPQTTHDSAIKYVWAIYTPSMTKSVILEKI